MYRSIRFILVNAACLLLCATAYGQVRINEVGYSGPLKARLRIRSNATPTLRMPGLYQELHDYHGEQPLIVEVDTTAADLAADYEQVSERVLTELSAAFGMRG